LADQEIQAGIIALKSVKDKLLMLSDIKGKPLSIGKQEFDDYKESMASLFVEIFNPEESFEEKVLV